MASECMNLGDGPDEEEATTIPQISERVGAIWGRVVAVLHDHDRKVAARLEVHEGRAGSLVELSSRKAVAEALAGFESRMDDRINRMWEQLNRMTSDIAEMKATINIVSTLLEKEFLATAERGPRTPTRALFDEDRPRRWWRFGR